MRDGETESILKFELELFSKAENGSIHDYVGIKTEDGNYSTYRYNSIADIAEKINYFFENYYTNDKNMLSPHGNIAKPL